MFSKLSIKLLQAVPRRLIQPVARRYIAGETKEAAISLALQLNATGIETTLDLLGENVTDRNEAQAAAAGYLDLIETMAATGVSRNISIKLTQLGVRLDEGWAWDNLKQVLRSARHHDFFVRIDMEDATLTDITLALYRRSRQHWPRVGAVLQARLRRTVDDARALALEGANIRLCKGIYLESAAVAHQTREKINAAYLAALEILLSGKTYLAIATHDQALLTEVHAVTKRHRSTHGDLEFQALLGVPLRSVLTSLGNQGYTVRLYLPYGVDWYAYSLRRLKENPQLIGAIARGVFKRDRLDTKQVKNDNAPPDTETP